MSEKPVKKSAKSYKDLLALRRKGRKHLREIIGENVQFLDIEKDNVENSSNVTVLRKGEKEIFYTAGKYVIEQLEGCKALLQEFPNEEMVITIIEKSGRNNPYLILEQ